MTASELLHVASLAAVWTMLLFGLRLTVAAIAPITPFLQAVARAAFSFERGPRSDTLARLEELHIRFMAAVTTPWSVPLMLIGAGLVGFGYATGSAGDVMMLISSDPSRWDGADRLTDCLSALSACVGMSCLMAALSPRRTVSMAVSAGFFITGCGIGFVAAAMP